MEPEDVIEMSPTVNPICCFKRLLAEIRNQIYRLTVVAPQPLHNAVDMRHHPPTNPYPLLVFKYGSGFSEDGESLCSNFNQPAIAATCKQFRQESLPIFYGENIFTTSIEDPGCVNFLSRLSLEQRKMVKNLRLRLYTTPSWPKWYSSDILSWNKISKCRWDAKLHLGWFKEKLQKEDIGLEEGVIHVKIAVPSGESHKLIWTTSPQGTCVASACDSATIERVRELGKHQSGMHMRAVIGND